jgi:hypothetical protein
MDFGPRRRINYNIGVARVFMFSCSLEQLNAPIPSKVSGLLFYAKVMLKLGAGIFFLPKIDIS